MVLATSSERHSAGAWCHRRSAECHSLLFSLICSLIFSLIFCRCPRVCVLVCVFSRERRAAGADVILVPSAFMPTTGEAHWEVRRCSCSCTAACYIAAAVAVAVDSLAHRASVEMQPLCGQSLCAHVRCGGGLSTAMDTALASVEHSPCKGIAWLDGAWLHTIAQLPYPGQVG